MTSTARTASDRHDAAVRPPASGSQAPNRRSALLEAAMLTVVVGVALGITAVFAARSSWVFDDFVILQEAAAGEFTPGYLTSAAIVHFSPGHRLGALALYRIAPADHEVALGFLLLVQAVAIVLVQRIVRWWAGPTWWSYVIALAFGVSPIVYSSVEWFTAGLLVLPAAALSLAAIHAYLHWHRSRRPGWLAWSVVAVAGALLFYEKAVLVPVELLLIRVLLLHDGRPVRDGLRIVRGEWRVWALYAVVVVAWLVAFRTRSYATPWEAPSLAAAVDFLGIAWLETLVPGALGLRLTGTEDAGLRALVVVVGQLLVIAAVVVSVRRRAGGWRPWAALAIAFLLSNIVVLTRVATWGPESSGHVLRYQLDVLLFLPVVLGAAFGARDAVVARARPGRRQAAVALPVAAALAVAGAASAWAVSDDWPGRASKRWLENLRGDLAKAQAGEARVNLLDDRIPPRLLESWWRPGAESLSQNLPAFASRLTFDRVVQPTYRVNPDGHLVPVRFRRYAGGDLGRLMRRRLIRSAGARARVTSRGLCLSAPRTGFAQLEVLPAATLSGRRWYLRTTYVAGGTGMFVAVNRGVPYPDPPDRGLPPARVPTTRLLALGELPKGPPIFAGVRIDVPPGVTACFDRFEIGAFVPTSARPS